MSPGSTVVSTLELEQLAKVEVTSEDPNFPIESALSSGTGPGWRPAERGSQIIRIIFDKPRPLHRIMLEFGFEEQRNRKPA